MLTPQTDDAENSEVDRSDNLGVVPGTSVDSNRQDQLVHPTGCAARGC
jgi:hypothetical protein